MAVFDFQFKHKSGRMNQVADVLSYKEELVALILLANMSANVENILIQKRIKENLKKDPVVKTILKLMKEGKTRQFWMEDDLLWAKGGRLYALRTRDLRRTLLKKCPDTLWVGHLG